MREDPIWTSLGMISRLAWLLAPRNKAAAYIAAIVEAARQAKEKSDRERWEHVT